MPIKTSKKMLEFLLAEIDREREEVGRGAAGKGLYPDKDFCGHVMNCMPPEDSSVFSLCLAFRGHFMISRKKTLE